MDIIERIKKLYNLSTRNSNTAASANLEPCICNECDHPHYHCEQHGIHGEDVCPSCEAAAKIQGEGSESEAA